MTIRIGFIGLSANAAGTSWASNAHLPYLLSARGKEQYKIVALANTSVESAQASIKKYELDPSTKAYGDVQQLADDPDVDLVVVSTRVDDHYKTGLPAVKAGKAVFIEWPLAQDVKHAKELVEAAKQSGSKTVVGVQGRYAPPIVKLKEVLDSGVIGDLLSSEIVAAGGTGDRVKLAHKLEYFTDKSVGGNPITIGLGHLWSPAQWVLGEVTNIQSRTQIQRPTVQLTDGDKVVKEVTTNVPDLVNVTGSLTAHKDATISVRYRRGQQFKGDAALTWTVNGEKGEAKLTAWDGASLNAGGYGGKGVTVEVHDFATDTIKNYEWKWEDWQEELPIVARNIARTYDAFALGEGVPTFEEALRRHEQIEAILQ